MIFDAIAPGTTVAGRYTVRGELGAGGMAAVYLAFDARLNMDVALKILPRQLAADRTFLARFRREGHTLAGLTHPNILRLYDLGEDPDKELYFLVLEHMRGGTLRDRLARGSLQPHDAISLLRPIAAAVDYAHARNVIHRDLKPSNILFDEDGRVVVGDFGLARLMDPQTGSGPNSGVTLTLGQLVGTPAYMAPELVEGSPPGPAVDRYAIGVIAYELLAGRVPYSGETPQAIMVQVVTRPLPSPRQINPYLTPGTERTLLKMLARDPALRFATSSEFVTELANTLARAQPISSPVDKQPSASIPRRPVLALIGAVALLCVVLILVGASLVFSRLIQPQPQPTAVATDATLANQGLNLLPGAELVGGEYIIRRAGDGPIAGPRLPISGASNDAQVSVDARVTSLDPRGEILLRCRSINDGGPDGSAYEFAVNPQRRAFDFRFRRGVTTLPIGGLEGISFTNTIPEIAAPDEIIRLQLICVNETIVASINNQVVGLAQDSRLRAGAFELSVGGQAGVQVEGHFKNLTAGPPPSNLPQRPASTAPTGFLTTFPRSGGEIHFTKASPEKAEFPGIFTSEDLADSTLAVDAQVVAGDERAGVNMDCRVNDRNWYQLTVLPVARSFELKRRVNNIDSSLVPRTPTNAIADRHSPLHIELRCVGDALSVRINNRTVALVHDSTYRTGKSIVQGNGPEGTALDVRVTRVAAQPEAGPNSDTPPAPAKPGTVLLSDDFSDADHGWLPQTSFQGPGVGVAYSGGAYHMTRTADTTIGYVYTIPPGKYDDVMLSVDATVDRGVLELKCRVDESGAWYAWRVSPQEQSSTIVRTRTNPAAETVVLSSANQVTAMNAPDRSNHYELSCVGDQISAKINGTLVGSARDDAFKSGLILIQSGGVDGPTDARLEKLVLVQQ